MEQAQSLYLAQVVIHNYNLERLHILSVCMKHIYVNPLQITDTISSKQLRITHNSSLFLRTAKRFRQDKR